MLSFSSADLVDPARAFSLEWLETNGLGGFASSSAAGANTRRYHGLLTAALKPPVDRFVTLSKIEEKLINRKGVYELSTNCYPGAIHPLGYNLIKSFSLDPFPRWIFLAGGTRVEKTVLLQYDSNTVWIAYRLVAASGALVRKTASVVRMEARPLFAFRNYHHLSSRNDFCDQTVREIAPGVYEMQPYAGLPKISISLSSGEFSAAPDWYLDFEYPVDRERGLDFREDLFNPGVFISPEGCKEWVFRFSIGEEREPPPREELAAEYKAKKEMEIARRRALLKGFEKSGNPTKRLVQAADTFIVKRGDAGRTVIAGYPWFTDWGRDTMISLPGLALATGRTDVAKEILLTFARHVHRGLIPNRFPDGAEFPAYNTVDAALWFVIAADETFRETRDIDFLKGIYPALAAVIEGYQRGTLNRIYMDGDCLISAGGPGDQLTWMDAKVGDWVVTPRDGKPVEINALWYNALCAMARAADVLDAPASGYADLAGIVRREFEEKFWNPERGCLYDVIRPSGPDPAIRPNQVFALSLRDDLLSPEKAESILTVIERNLLTPYGLRTLAPSDPAYKGAYTGGVLERDGAYHQGTVWPWPLGHFIFAVWKARGKNAATLKYARDLISGLDAHLSEAGLNAISEIFDGDSPHKPRGCFAQAWSVAELLRVRVEIEKCEKSAKPRRTSVKLKTEKAPRIRR